MNCSLSYYRMRFSWRQRKSEIQSSQGNSMLCMDPSQHAAVAFILWIVQSNQLYVCCIRLRNFQIIKICFKLKTFNGISRTKACIDFSFQLNPSLKQTKKIHSKFLSTRNITHNLQSHTSISNKWNIFWPVLQTAIENRILL